MRNLAAVGVCMAVATIPLAAGADEPPKLSDADLVAYAAKPFDKAAMMGRRVVIGLHHGLRVIVDFPCSDICPGYTTRIIHYAQAPGAACEAAGGATVTRAVPYSIAVIEKQFCVPKVLVAGR
jgi:hypothetical protein